MATAGYSFEKQVEAVIQDVFLSRGFQVIRWTKLPYLCEGDLAKVKGSPISLQYLIFLRHSTDWMTRFSYSKQCPGQTLNRKSRPKVIIRVQKFIPKCDFDLFRLIYCTDKDFLNNKNQCDNNNNSYHLFVSLIWVGLVIFIAAAVVHLQIILNFIKIIYQLKS